MTLAKKMERFKCGDKVWWESQGNGNRKKKIGTIITVIPSEELVTKSKVERLFPNHFYHIRSQKLPRDHESYLVQVGFPGGKMRLELYHPRVSTLRRME